MTGDDVILAAAVAGIDIKPATVRVWAHRGNILRQGKRYDRASVIEWLAATRRADQDPRVLVNAAKPV